MPLPSPFSTAVPAAAGDHRFVLRGLDGLRALAVAGVVVFHLWPGLLPGGLVGVDLFFVISGYLITGLLLREGAFTGRMRLPQFWLRRLRRLVPAMLACIVVCASLAWLLGGDVLVHLRRQVLGALTYTSNWTSIAADNDYFRDTSPELLTNFWSLAVEEQFYLAWPVVLVLTCMLVATWRRRTLVPACLAGASLLAMAVLFWATGDVNRVYYGLDTHAFGLMLGACLALLIPWSMYPPLPGHRVHALERSYSGARNLLRIVIGWASLVLLPLLARVLSERHPGVLLPWGLLAASLLGLGIIQALLPDVRGQAAEGLRRLLSLPPLVWIGRRSYGLYLWHWPLMVLAHYAAPGIPETVRGVAVVVLTVVVAAASYRWLENPVRRHGFLGALRLFLAGLGVPGRRRWATAAALGLSALMVAGTAVACVHSPEMTEAETVVAQGEQELQRESEASVSPSPSASASEESGPQAYEPRPGGQDVSLVGDSVSLASVGALREKLSGIAVDAKVSRSVAEGIDLLDAQRRNGSLRRIVVVSLSTNSAITQEDLHRLTDIAESGSVRQLVLVTGQAPPDLAWVAQSNAVEREAAAHQPRIVIADWARATDGKPELLVSDGVHPQPEGQRLYAQTVADAVATAQQELRKATAGS